MKRTKTDMERYGIDEGFYQASYRDPSIAESHYIEDPWYPPYFTEEEERKMVTTQAGNYLRFP